MQPLQQITLYSMQSFWQTCQRNKKVNMGMTQRSYTIVLSIIAHYLHEGDSEVESLSQASEGNEGLSGKVACCHLTERLLILSRGAVACEAAH